MLSKQGVPANRWSRSLAKIVDAYNATRHSSTGMVPDVSFYCATTDSREQAISAGLKEHLLQGELGLIAGQSYQALKIKIEHKIHVRCYLPSSSPSSLLSPPPSSTPSTPPPALPPPPSRLPSALPSPSFQANLELKAQKMIANSAAAAKKKMKSTATFSTGDSVNLLAPGDPLNKRNRLKPRHASEPGTASLFVMPPLHSLSRSWSLGGDRSHREGWDFPILLRLRNGGMGR